MSENGHKPGPKLAIAYPHNGEVRQCFMDSYTKFREFDLQHGQILGCVIPQQGMYIAGQRNYIVKKFLTTPFEWLLSIDSDQNYEPEIPYLLIQSAEDQGARIMSALYFGILAGRYSPMWWQKTPVGEFATVNEIVPGIQEIAACGFGMCLVHRSVFEEMAPHYPDDPWKWFGHDLTVFNGDMQRFGEDLCFCNRAAEMGVKMYGDSRIVIGHEKIVDVNLEMFMKMAKLAGHGEQPTGHVLEPIV